MPTEPVADLLPRHSDSEVQRILDALAESLDEVVNFGTHVFVWQNNACEGKADEVAPVSQLFRHLLEMVDAVALLVRSSSIEPSHTCLRSAFEASVQLHWILQADSDRRGMAFMAWHVHQRLKLYQRHDRSTEQGKQLAKQLEGTPYEDIDTSQFDLAAARANLESLLQRPRYQEAAAEYERLRSEGERNPAWYRLFGGHRTLEQLATVVGMPEWYQILYRQWSAVTHATDIITGKVLGNGGQTEILALRHPIGVESVYSFSVSLALKTYRLLMGHYDRPKLNVIRDWYIREIRDMYNSGSSASLIVAEDT